MEPVSNPLLREDKFAPAGPPGAWPGGYARPGGYGAPPVPPVYDNRP